MIFLLKFVLKSSFFRLGVELRFWSCNLCSRCAKFYCVFCNSVSADRSGMVALRFLSAAGACVILLCLAFRCCKSHCNGCMKVANGALAADFPHFGANDFPFILFFFKSSFFRLGVELRFCSCNLCSHCAKFYCVSQLSLCRSQWNGCVKVPRCCECARDTIVFSS